MIYKSKRKGERPFAPAFTLIELLVVIAIIGLLVTLSVLALANARVASRDSKRVSDVKQMQSALELFFDANNRYPTNAEFQTGSLASFASTTGTTAYMSVIPTAPTPNDGSCSSGDNVYAYNASVDSSSYTLNFCIAKKINDLSAGNLVANPGGIIKGFNCGDNLSYSGETYPTVMIGTQCWMAKNMDTGTMVAGATNQSDNSILEKYCYNDTASNCSTYGGFYQWDEAMQYSTSTGAQGICPIGWHIPADAEQYILENYLKDSGQTCNANRSSDVWDCATAGTKLKTGGTSGFSGLLAGYRSTAGLFRSQGPDAYFWSSSVSGTSAWNRVLTSGYATVDRYTISRASGFSVRCLRD